MTNKELLEDLLIEYDELDMQPMICIPDPIDRAKRWKRELEYAIEHLKADTAREIFEEIEDLMREWFDFFRQEDDIRESCAIMAALSQISELKMKYTEVKDESQNT